MTTFLPKLKFSLKHYQFNDSQLKGGILFSLSRHVLCSIIETNNWSNNHQIIMPGSICEEALKPFLRAGIKICCYGLDSSLSSNMKSIRDNVKTNTVAIYVVHYFGKIDSNIDEIRTLCNKLDIMLIEDCALCSPQNMHSGIGSYGDYSFFSLWKYLPTPDGSIAYNRGRARPLKAPSNKANLKRVTKNLIRLLLGKNIKKKLRHNASQIPLDKTTHNYSELLKNKSSSQAISFLSRKIIRYIDFHSVANSRRYNYRFLAEHLKNHSSIKLLWMEIDKNFIPYSLPLITSKPAHLKQFLIQHGIESEISVNNYFPWKDRVNGNIEEMKSIRQLASSVLCIPIHQSLSKRELIKIITCLNSYE